MNKHLAPIALSVGLLGLVGGVAAANAFTPAEKAPQRIEVVTPAAQVVTVTPTVDPAIAKAKAAAAAKVKAAAIAKAKADAVAAAKKKAAQAAAVKAATEAKAVESAQAPAPKPSTVQRQAIVSPNTPTPAPITPAPVVNPAPKFSPVKPPGAGVKLDPGAANPPTSN